MKPHSFQLLLLIGLCCRNDLIFSQTKFWQQMNGTLSNRVSHLISNTNGDVLALTSLGILRSNDHGNSWIKINTGFQGTVLCLAVNKNANIFAGTNDGSILRSNDNGQSWRVVGVVLNNTPIRCLTISQNGYFYAGTDGRGVLRSIDDGQNWTHVNAGLTNTNVLSLTIDSHRHLFAGTYLGGVFRSVNHGENWVPFNAGLTDSIVFALAVDSSGYVFAGTSQQGIFRSVLPTTSVREIVRTAQISLSLEQNYPNPFNPVTTIEFSLPRSDYVMLKVYNTLGEEVAPLVKQNFAAGTHQVVWDAKGMPSGIYFYRLQAGDFVQTRKLVLVR